MRVNIKLIFNCLNSTIETLQKGVNTFNVNNKNTRMTSMTSFCVFIAKFTPFLNVSIVDFGQVNVSRVRYLYTAEYAKTASTLLFYRRLRE